MSHRFPECPYYNSRTFILVRKGVTMERTPWYIMVIDEVYSYGEEGAVTGVVGPFRTEDEAKEYDRKTYLRIGVKTLVTKVTPPGGDIYNTKYGSF